MELRGFFRRKPLDFRYESPVQWISAEPVNLDNYLFAPVQSKHWKQHELWDGTYTLDDLADYHEMAQVSAENEKRAQEAIRLQQQLTS
ncbi:MAG: DUF6889 family protein [Oscillospiraceae bacterium]